MVSENGFHMLYTAILGSLKYFLLKAVNQHYDGKYITKYLKSILQELGSSISLSTLNTMDQNFMKLDVFFKFDNCPYPTMPSGVVAFFYENSPFETVSAL